LKVYADADKTELMKMLWECRMLKIERDEIDEMTGHKLKS
jgi:hypothetical protein